jgi:hypothetical protein
MNAAGRGCTKPQEGAFSAIIDGIAKPVSGIGPVTTRGGLMHPARRT